MLQEVRDTSGEEGGNSARYHPLKFKERAPMKWLLIVVGVGYAIGNHAAMFTHRQPKPQMVVIPAFTTQVLATNRPAQVAELEHSTIATKKKKRKRK
jgi:hypothetical protein